MCSFLIKDGFFVRNATLFYGNQAQSEHDLIGFKYDKNFIPFIVLTEQKGGAKSGSPFRDIAEITFFSKYFRANAALYVISEPTKLEVVEFGQRQTPRVLVCPISNFDGSLLPEVRVHFSGYDLFAKITKNGGMIKDYKKNFDIIWRLSEFNKVGLIEDIIQDLSLEKPTSEEYINAYTWLSKELMAHYSLCLLQIISRTFLAFTQTHRSKGLTEWFMSEQTETRVERKLTDFENKTIEIVNYIIENREISYRLPYIVNKYLYSTEALSSDELSLIMKLLNETRFKDIKQYIERK